MERPRADITHMLADLQQGRREVLDQLLPLIYAELHRLAHRHLSHERSGHTLNTTALVHEAYLKLIDQDRVEWQNRAHFFAVASLAMRRILVNYAKMRRRDKRGGGAPVVSLDEALHAFSDERAEELVVLDEALTRLARINERAAEVVQYRFFGGLSIEETAEVLGTSPMTVKRDWRLAKAWLHREVAPGAVDA